MKTIEFAEGLRLPIEIATSPVDFLAGRGRGKTRGAMKLAGGLYEAGIPPIVLDSVGIWYGLRLARDGKSKGLDIPILGGFHGDAPLLPTAGKVVAEALVRTNSPCILDTTAFESGAEVVRFMTDFAATFYRQKMRHPSPVHLFLEEADEWVPQNPQKNETRMLGAFQQIARVGRNFGIGFTVISQRPQGISKKVLNLADVLIVLGFNGSHERDAIADWMKDKEIDKDKRQDALDMLPRLGWNKVTKKDGGALIWAPMLDLFGIHRILAPDTFDSSATPEIGTAAKRRDVGKLDMGALGEAMAASVEEAKANDPKELRAEIARLKAELARKRAAISGPARVEMVTKIVPDPELMTELREARAATEDHQRNAMSMASALVSVTGRIEAVLRAATAATTSRAATHGGTTYAGTGGKAVRGGGVARPATVPRPRASGPGIDLPKGERVVLVAIAQHAEGVTREQLTVLTGYKRSSRDTYLQRLRERGLIEASGDQVGATDDGIRALGDDYDPLPTGAALREHWLGRLPEGERKVLEAVCRAFPESVSREDLDEITGYKRSSRDTYIQRLSARRLVESVGRGEVRASAALFDAGVA